MSLEAIKEALDELRRRTRLDGGAFGFDMVDKAEAEIAALEKAAKTIAVQSVHEEVGASTETMDAVDEAEALMETIAKEAE